MSIESPLGDHTLEASIVIEGVELTYAQSMTVRVALATFAMTLSEWPKGDKTAAGYHSRIDEVNALVSRGAR